jgi:hypothetical protein
MKRHLSACPPCREKAGQQPKNPALQTLATQLANRAPKAVAEEVRQGQLWTLRRELAGWGPKDRYYNPPWVLVVSLGKAISDAVQVTQVYDDRALEGPGDVPLGNEWGGFAEAWNRYTLRRSDLDACWGEVGPEVLYRIQKEEEMGFTALDRNSLLYRFRQLEVEAGYFFASQAAGALLDQVEWAYEDTDALLIDVERVIGREVRIPLWATEQADFSAALLAADLGDWGQVHYADSEEGEAALGRLAVVEGGRIASLDPVPLRITQEVCEQGKLFLAGECVGLDAFALEEATVSCGWLRPDGQLDPPEQFDLDPEEGFFSAVFPFSARPEGEFRLVIVRERASEAP